MTRDALKAAVQPHLEQDFDALYDDFVKETGGEDPLQFVAHLEQTRALTAEQATTLRDALHPADVPTTPSQPPRWTGGGVSLPAPPPPQFDDFDDDARTVVARDEEIEELVARSRAEPDPPARQPSAEATDPEVGNRAPATGPTPRRVPSLGNSGPIDLEPSTDFLDDEAPRTRRTLFRRQTDGGLRMQTDAIENETRERQRRRRDRRSDAEPSVGEEGRYAFVGLVGEGAMGKVHLASDSRLHRKVAFKAMSSDIADHEQLASKFTAEAQITAQLDHPNIVPIYNLETESSYTMKLIKGRTVEAIIKETLERLKSGAAPEEVHTLTGRLELFLRACDALYYAHCRGVVHRDLKPENIMVGEFNELYVMDWGIARLMSGHFDDKVTIAETKDEGDLVIGTPGYMSPEQAEGMNAQLDGRSDQYSLGLILFELLTLRPAVSGRAPLKVVMRHQDGEKDPMVHALRERIPPALRAIVHKATKLRREDRYGSVRELADDVRRFLHGESVRARPDGPVQAIFRWMGKHREITALAVMTIFLGFGVITLTAIAYTQVALARAETQEQQRSNLMATAAAQSSLIDGQFLKYEGLLSVIATHAEDSLVRAPIGQPKLYQALEFDEDRGPNDLVDSKHYGIPVSLAHPAYVLSPGVRLSSVLSSMRQLDVLDRHYFKVLLRSHSEAAGNYTPKRAQRALVDVGVPIARAYVGLKNGVHSAYPGHGNWPAGFDPRATAWYDLAKQRRGPTWGAPSEDLHGLGTVLTCAQSLYDSEDNLLGVAGIDVTFDYVIEELLELPGFDEAPNSEVLLIDASGHIVVRSGGQGDGEATDGIEIEMPMYDNEEVVVAMSEKRTGYLLNDDRELILYNRMNSIGWYYVVQGPERELMALGD